MFNKTNRLIQTINKTTRLIQTSKCYTTLHFANRKNAWHYLKLCYLSLLLQIPFALLSYWLRVPEVTLMWSTWGTEHYTRQVIHAVSLLTMKILPHTSPCCTIGIYQASFTASNSASGLLNLWSHKVSLVHNLIASERSVTRNTSNRCYYEHIQITKLQANFNVIILVFSWAEKSIQVVSITTKSKIKATQKAVDCPYGNSYHFVVYWHNSRRSVCHVRRWLALLSLQHIHIPGQLVTNINISKNTRWWKGTSDTLRINWKLVIKHRV